ncbi:MAG TPA: electron transport complex subunit RsxC [Eubacteriales bacterium]|nr:electron transport complex subunit RsxC [Eubacteriales bacterium]
MRRTFRGGVHPLHKIHEGKPLAMDKRIEVFMPDHVVIPMGMHLGAPSTPCVNKGDRVLTGQIIGTPNGFLGVPVHASISGTVSAVEPRQQLKAHPEMCVCIDSDGQDEWVELTPVGAVESVEPAAIMKAVREAGICGMGGAAFPAGIKLAIPEGKKAEVVIINGSECEPYLTCDHRVMIEEPERVVNGLRLLMRAVGVTKGYIAIEDNKPQCVESMRLAANEYHSISVVALKTKYPQGGEKQLIEVITGKQIPQKKLPIDVGALVFNIQTAAAVADAVLLGKPLIERITTVTGAVGEPKNYRLRIGTEFGDAIDAAGGYSETFKKLIAGGPMTGFCCPNDHISVQKASGGILLFDEEMAKQDEEGPCIRCAKCVSACPIGLLPYRLKFDVEQRNWARAKVDGAMDCIACGVCAYTCPANRHITSSIKVAKEMITAEERRQKK